MNGQFVDLFDRQEHGFNYWAGIGVCAGLFLAFGHDIVQVLYDGLVQGVEFATPEGEPQGLLGMILVYLKGRATASIGFALVLVMAATFVKADFLLPLFTGIGVLVWDLLLRMAGLDGGGGFSPGFLVRSFLWGFLLAGSMVLAFRICRNKLIALAFGMAFGSLLMSVYDLFLFDVPLVWIARFGAIGMFEKFIAGVFLYGGIAYHFCSRGVPFGEYGCPSELEGAGTEPSKDPVLGRTRGPLTTVLLLLITLDLYALGWIYQVYREIRLRSLQVTTITPGKALGFLFIPVFNLFWALWLWVDLPRAIEELGAVDPPGGMPPDRWAITGSMVLGSVLGVVGGFFWRPALFLAAIFLWTGILLAQSALNSHWSAHRRGTI